MKLRVYLDTSVFSAYYDQRMPERRSLTQAFWLRLDEFDVATSELTREELTQTSDPAQRRRLTGLLKGFRLVELTLEMRELAARYLAGGVFSGLMLNDALHVAAAVLDRQDILLSWNFRHLVNRRRRAMVNEINISLSLPTIEIVAPPEV